MKITHIHMKAAYGSRCDSCCRVDTGGGTGGDAERNVS
jgi:hypothetical protein